jgi:hypothetical protein
MLTCTVEYPSIVSSRANRISSKFAIIDKCGRGILQQVRSVRNHMIACAKLCRERTVS